MAALSLDMNAERARMIVEDLCAEPATEAIIAEGTPLRPLLVAEVIATPEAGHWIIPTPEATRRNLLARGGSAIKASSDPERAYEHRIQRELIVSAELEREANELGFQVLHVEAATPLDEVKPEVEAYFLPILEGLPVARTAARRTELRRAENLALLRHLEDFLEEAPHLGSAETYVSSFACECGRQGDAERVELTLTDYERLVEAGLPAIAASHLETQRL